MLSHDLEIEFLHINWKTFWLNITNEFGTWKFALLPKVKTEIFNLQSIFHAQHAVGTSFRF